jgi:hypothetical protein
VIHGQSCSIDSNALDAFGSLQLPGSGKQPPGFGPDAAAACCWLAVGGSSTESVQYLQLRILGCGV